MASLKDRLKAFVSPAVQPPRELTPVERYYQLCDKRDSAYARVAAQRTELAALNEQAQVLQAKASAKAREISDSLGGADWLALKKEISTLARALGRIPPRI